jgi:regulator of sigma E protease
MSEKSPASMKLYSRVILLAAVVIAALILIIRNIGVSKNILLVLVGFGAVVLIHEFGHFIVAKLCGIKVEELSIFMPPILFGIKKQERGWRIRVLPELLREERKESEGEPTSESPEADLDDGLLSFNVGRKMVAGETEYRIGLIPFGGFVKMLGQEDVGSVKTNPDPRSFANKPVLARAAVLTAGVTFNVISAVIVYIIVFLMGINLAGPTVGGVLPGSPAEKAGIKAGDEIIEVAGEDGRLDFSDIMMPGVLSAKGEQIPIKIRREDGSIIDISLAAEQTPGAKFRSFGIKRAESLNIAKLFDEDANLLFTNTGLMPKDRIKAVDSIDVNSNWQLEEIVERTFAPDVVLHAERSDSSGRAQLVEGKATLGFAPMINPDVNSETDLLNICSIVPRLCITAADETLSLKDRLPGLLRMANKKERLKQGDIILGMADVNNPTYFEMREITKAYAGKALTLTVQRSDVNGVTKRMTVTVVPKKDSGTGRVVIGLGVALDVEHPVVAKTIPTGQYPQPIAIPRGATITAVDGVAVSNFYDVARELKKNAGHRTTIDWRLDSQTAGDVAIDVGGLKDIIAMQGLFAKPVPFADLERLYKANGPVDAMMMGYKKTKTFIIQTYVTLQRLIGGLVSPKELMGPVGILTFSYRIVSAQPLIYYAYFLGLISASIAVLNFLPLPPFDGGLVLLLLVEKIKGSALSIRTQEAIAYVGWGMVLVLLLYVTFNDIVRSVFGG